jgi:hypothetical protein
MAKLDTLCDPLRQARRGRGGCAAGGHKRGRVLALSRRHIKQLGRAGRSPPDGRVGAVELVGDGWSVGVRP